MAVGPIVDITPPLRPRREKYPLDAVDRAADKMRELAQRWQDGLSVERHTIAENYAVGSVSLVCNLHIRMTKAGDAGGAVSVESPFVNREAFASAVYTVDVPDHRSVLLGDQENVLIFDVEGVKSPEGLSYPSFVRLYRIQDEVEDCFGGLLFQSAITGSYHTYPGISNREISVRIAMLRSVKFDITHGVIKGGAKVMDCIPHHQENLFGNILSNADAEKAIRSIRIVLDGDIVHARPMESSRFQIEIIDVLIGPFDL